MKYALSANGHVVEETNDHLKNLAQDKIFEHLYLSLFNYAS